MDKRQLKHIALTSAVWTNAAIAVAYLLSAFIGYADPRSCGYLSLLGLAYPLFLVAMLAFAVLWAFAGWRRLWISGAALVLTIPQLAAFCPVNFGSPATDGSGFRLMTYNCFGMPAGDGVTETAADEILRQDADFVCLQETPSVAGMKAHFNSDVWGAVTRRYSYIDAGDTTSLGYMSKHAVTTLEVHDNGQYFCYAVYKTTLGGLPTYIINAHLESIGLTKSDKRLYMGLTSPRSRHSIRGVRSRLMSKLRHAFEQRAAQAEELRAKADSLQVAHPEAVVMICGDFNDTPYSYAYLTARGDFSDAYADGGLGPVVTYNRNRFYFHIDQILYLDSRVEAVACSRGESPASDHYALVADFAVKKMN